MVAERKDAAGENSVCKPEAELAGLAQQQPRAHRALLPTSVRPNHEPLAVAQQQQRSAFLRSHMLLLLVMPIHPLAPCRSRAAAIGCAGKARSPHLRQRLSRRVPMPFSYRRFHLSPTVHQVLDEPTPNDLVPSHLLCEDIDDVAFNGVEAFVL
eukprot:2991408-Rhodomonas_salina.1